MAATARVDPRFDRGEIEVDALGCVITVYTLSNDGLRWWPVSRAGIALVPHLTIAVQGREVGRLSRLATRDTMPSDHSGLIQLHTFTGVRKSSEAKPQTRKHVGVLRLASHHLVLPRLRRGSRLDGETLTHLPRFEPSRLLGSPPRDGGSIDEPRRKTDHCTRARFGRRAGPVPGRATALVAAACCSPSSR